jgi:hypothetical protein
MLQLRFPSRLLLALLAAVTACGDDEADVPQHQDAASAATQPDGSAADAAFSCTPPGDCPDVEVASMSLTACCSPVTDCGYEVAELDDMILTDFPMAADFRDMLVEGDPLGKCAPEWWFFGTRPGLEADRIEVEDGDDILITPDCESYTVLAFILPGCCLPDNSCGLSTDQSWPTLEYLAEYMEAPFTRPECVSADVLNQQFRDSVVLEGFARTTATGSCDYAALDAQLAE